jgi:hypothetical protein
VGVVETLSVPRECLECGSEKLSGGFWLADEAKDVVMCWDCGVAFHVDLVLEEEEGEPVVEIVTPFGLCPHCLGVDELVTNSGEEWCGRCGLDPNILDYPTTELSRLWKKDSGIQQLMGRDVSMCEPDRSMGQFLRTKCGPHCIYGEECSQETLNLIKCYRKEFPTTPLGGSMSKKSRKKRRQESRARKGTIKRTEERALVQCAGSGWFKKVLHANSPNPQQTGNPKRGSGT